jgi:hypothetical protein
MSQNWHANGIWDVNDNETTYDLLFLFACRKYADSGGRSGLGTVLSVERGANGGSHDLVSSPFKGDSIYLLALSNVEAEPSYLDHIGCIGRQYMQYTKKGTNLLDQTIDQLSSGGKARVRGQQLTNIMVARGPARTRVKSTTLIPASGLSSGRVDDHRRPVDRESSLQRALEYRRM